MPSSKILAQKEAATAVLAEKIQNSVAGVLVNYTGITVEQDTALRNELRKAGVDYHVYKNTMTARACKAAGYADMEQYLSGMNALAVSSTDPVAAAKILKDYADMMVDGTFQMLCDATMAANGKIDVEAEDLKPKGIMVDWCDYIRAVCMEDGEMAENVRKKGKSLKGCFGKLLKYAFEHQEEVDKDIIKAAGVKASRVTFGMPGQKEARKLASRSWFRDARLTSRRKERNSTTA